jgi:hypothetical protein
MADYDVGALALVVPATSGPMTTYRPAVSVRNNGIHDALASGYLRIYAAGLLVFETELYSATIPAHDTGTAQAVNYWTPAAEGSYIIHAYLSTPLDQVESNNMLAPVTIQITGETPPVPPVVQAHAAQHEEGGTDEVSIDGLIGRAADPQDALAHAATHQAGGTDALNVGSLQGILAQNQPAQAHGNTRHNPVMATEAELVAHQGSTAVHTAATNLANRETTGPYTGLVPLTQVALGSEIGGTDETRLLARDRIFRKVPSLGANAGSFSIIPGPGYTDIVSLSAPAPWLSDDMQFQLQAHCLIQAWGTVDASISFQLHFGGTILAEFPFDISAAAFRSAVLRASVMGLPNSYVVGSLELLATDPISTLLWIPVFTWQPLLYSVNAKDIRLAAQVTSTNIQDKLVVYSGFARALHTP